MWLQIYRKLHFFLLITTLALCNKIVEQCGFVSSCFSLSISSPPYIPLFFYFETENANDTCDLEGSSCMVKITPNAPNNFSRSLLFENRILVQRKYLSHHLCHFVPFFKQPKTENQLSFPRKMKSF